MIEPINQPTPQVFEQEYKFFERLGQQDEDLNELVNSVPEEKSDLKNVIRSLSNIKVGYILDREKLSKLRVENQPIYNEVMGVYKSFLESKIEELS